MKEKEWNYVYKSDSIGLAQIIQDTRSKLIAEFLRDWGWGMFWMIHYKRYSLPKTCKCSLIEYWDWFENKWEKMMSQECK